MPQKSNKPAKKITQTVAVADSSGMYCEYICDAGRWELIASHVSGGYYCDNTLLGGCTGASYTYVPPNPPPHAFASTTVLANNVGEYVYERATKTARLVRGRSSGRRILKPVLSLKEIAAIDPKLAEQLRSFGAMRKASSVTIQIPAAKSK